MPTLQSLFTGSLPLPAVALEVKDIPIHMSSFGLPSAPHIVMKIVEPMVAWLRQVDCWIFTYVENNLVMATSIEEARLQPKLAT